MADHEDRLRDLALCNEAFMISVLAIDVEDARPSGLEPAKHALVQLASLVAIGAGGVSLHACVEAALNAGVTVNEIVGTLIAVAPTVGVARVVAAAPEVALALGYDVDSALEMIDERL